MHTINHIKKLYNLVDDFGFAANELAALETALNITLPKKLKEYYLSLAKYPNINYAHNRLLKPSKEIGFSTDGYLVFYEEHQNAAYWGIKEEDLALENPPVWGNYGTETQPVWHLETLTTSSFLLLMAVYNGTFGGLAYNANSFDIVSVETLSFIKNNWQEIPEISFEKQTIFTANHEEVICLNFDEKEQCTAIFIGTSNQKRFDTLISSLKVNWSFISTEDTY